MGGRQQAVACARYVCRTDSLLATESDARQPRSPQPALPGTSIAAPRHTTARTLMAERCSTASTASRGKPQASSRAPRAGASHSRRSRCSPISLDTSSRPCSPKFWRAAGRCGEACAGDAREAAAEGAGPAQLHSTAQHGHKQQTATLTAAAAATAAGQRPPHSEAPRTHSRRSLPEASPPSPAGSTVTTEKGAE